MSTSAVSHPRPDRPDTTMDRFSIWIIAILTILYVVSFPIHQLPMLVIIPVLAVGLFYRTPGGLFAGIIAIFLNALLMITQKENNVVIIDNAFLLGHFLVLLVGWSTGKLRETNDNRIRARAELLKSERYLTILQIATSNILNLKKTDGEYQYLANLEELFAADCTYLLHLDTNEGQYMQIASSVPAKEQISGAVLKPGESAIIDSILQSGHALAIGDVLSSQDTINSTLFKNLASPVHSILSIPLAIKGHKLGTVLLAYHLPQRFTPAEIDNAEKAGNHISLALWNVKQDTESKKHLREVETLASISLTLSEAEHIGLNDVLQLIVNSAKELISNVEQAVIHLLNEEEGTLTYGAVIGFDNPAGGEKKMHAGEGIAGQVVLSGETINITDVRTDPRFIKLDRDPTYCSLMVTPVHSGERKLGTISVSSNLPFAFNANDRNLLSQLGTQAAIAIENAHLLESTQQALKETNALYRINQGLVASLDPQKVLEDTVDLLQKNFGYYHVQVYLREPENGNFVMHNGSGEIGRRLKEQGHHLRAGEGIVGYVAETKEAFFTNNVDEVFFFARNPLLPETKSELAVPVKIEDQIIGLLDIQQAPPASLSKRDMQLVNAVADQLAIALQKANLHTSLQAALQVEKAIRNEMVQSERLVTMGRLLASVSHELNNPLQAIQNALFLLREETGISLQGKMDLDIVLSEAERMSALIERLRSTYRPIQAEDFLPTQVNNIIEDVRALIFTHLRHNQIVYEFHPDPSLPLIPALPNQLRQVIINLLMNAVEIMTSGGKLTVVTKLLQDTNEVLLSVSDTGPGIDPDLLPNIFDAFITNKQRGTGLGLTISYDIVMKHHGRISAENNPDAGALFQIWLPINNMEIE